MAGQGRSPCASLGFPKGDISYGKRYPLLSGICACAGICLLSRCCGGVTKRLLLLRDSRPFSIFRFRRNYYAEKCEMRALRQVRQGIRGYAQPHQLRVRRYPRHHLRLRLHQGQSHQGKAQEPPEHDVALPRVAARRGDHARHAPARGLEPALRGGPSCEAPRPQEAVGEGRRPEPHRVPQGPRLRHGGRQGEGGGRGDHRLLVHGQCGLVAGRQRRRRGSQDLHFRALPRPQGQGRAADDLRRERHFRAGQL